MITFPIAFIENGSVSDVWYGPRAFTTTDGVSHSQDAWRFWTEEDWKQKAPELTFVPVSDTLPTVADNQKVVRRPYVEWAVSNVATVGYDLIDKTKNEIRDDVVASLKSTDARMPRPLEDLYTDMQVNDTDRYGRLPQAVRDLHQYRLALRAKL